MNVLQVSKYYYPTVGGIEQVVRTIAEGLTPEDDARVLAAADGRVGTSETIHGVDVQKVATLGDVWSVPLSPTFPFALARAVAPADVVHVHLPNPVAVASYLALSDLSPGSRNHSLVVTYHSDVVRQSTAMSLYRPLLHRFLDVADHITVTSPTLLEHSPHLGPHEDDCTVVPLSVDLEEYGEYSGPSFDLPVDDDRPTFLFVGRLCYYKGVTHLVDAMAALPSAADLLVVGDGEDRETLERQARELGVTDQVSFLGSVSEQTLKYCYETADVFVLPSVEPSEAFGVVQLEAMAHGTPVVNTDLPTGVPWVSKHGVTGLTVSPGDSAELADALETLADSSYLRRTYGTNARERVEDHFRCERMVDRIRSIYESAVGNEETSDWGQSSPLEAD